VVPDEYVVIIEPSTLRYKLFAVPIVIFATIGIFYISLRYSIFTPILYYIDELVWGITDIPLTQMPLYVKVLGAVILGVALVALGLVMAVIHEAVHIASCLANRNASRMNKSTHAVKIHIGKTMWTVTYTGILSKNAYLFMIIAPLAFGVIAIIPILFTKYAIWGVWALLVNIAGASYACVNFVNILCTVNRNDYLLCGYILRRK
jgi:hypothetical protein